MSFPAQRLDLHTDILFHLISEHLHDHTDVLLAFSLSCREMRPLCQRILFRKVAIWITGGKHCQSRKVLESLTIVSSQTLSQVKELYLINYMRDSTIHGREIWYGEYGHLFEKTLRRFHTDGSVEILSIDGIFGPMKTVTPDKFDTRTLIEPLCLAQSVHSLELTNLPGDMVHLPFTRSLRHLTARYLAPYAQGLPSAMLPVGGSAALETLSLHPDSVSPNDPAYSLLSPASGHTFLTNLKHIDIYCRHGGFKAELAGTLQRCKASLQSIDLKIADEYRDRSPELGLDSLPKLRHLYFTIGIPGRGFAEDLQAIQNILAPEESSSGFCSLETLVIFVASNDWNETLEDVHPMCLGAFADHLISNRAKYSLLKQFVVCFVKADTRSPILLVCGNDMTWRVAETPHDWDLRIRTALEPLKTIGVEATVKWKSCSRRIWYSGLKDCER